MHQISNQSIFLRMKENLVKDNEAILIDKNGEYTQKEAFDIYIGIMNELSSLIKEDDICFIEPVIRKETTLICAAIVSIGARVIFGEPQVAISDCLKEIEDKITVNVIVSFADDKWIVNKDNKIIELSLTSQELMVKPLLEASKSKPAFYFSTSGSTGKKNVVALSEYSYINHIILEMDNVVEHSCSYSCVPINHAYGIGLFLQNLLCGEAVFISDSRNPYYALDIIEKYKCGSISNVPTFFYMLIEAQHDKPHDLSSLKYGVVAGGGYTKEQFLYIEKELGISLCSSYGMTEASTGITTSPASDPLEERCVGVGKPIANIEIVLKNDDDTINQKEGEICFKGYNLMLGYAEKGQLVLPLDNDGYFHTGDIGCIDEHGIYHIIDRKKNIIIRGGENLSPRAIENKILDIKGIKDVCVVGIPNKKYGEVVGAYLVSDVYKTLEEVKPLLSKVLLKNENPSILIIDSKMPLLSNGKHDRMLIKSILAKENA